VIAEFHTLADGLRLFIDADDEAIGRPIVEDRYELNELEFIAHTVQRGDLVADIGAHAGAYALRLARLVGSGGRVVAVEPHPDHARWLRRSIAANGLDAHVTVVEAAAGAHEGMAWLRHPPGGSSSHSFLEPGAPADGSLPVKVVALDDLALEGVRFIKIDVEGAEGLVLAGAARTLESSRPVVLAELHPHALAVVSRESAAGLIARMARLGYECRLLGAGVPGPSIADTPSNGVTSVVFLPGGRLAPSRRAGVR
jgi:FkbM family methyltransferase